MNKENWKYLSIGDCATVVGGGTPSIKNPEYWDGDISWISPKDLSNNTNKYVSRGERFITKKGLENSSAKILPENSLLFSSRAPIGYLAINTQPMATNQGFKSLILKDEFDVEFFYYLFKQKTEYIKNFSSGSTFQEISGSEVKNLKFLIPPYKEQKQIAKILSKLDKKIELNQKQNVILQEIAKTLFKSWFINFDPVKAKAEGRPTGLNKEISDLFPNSFEDSKLAEIPTGWHRGNIEDIAEKVSDKYKREEDWSNEKLIDLSRMPSNSIALNSHGKGEELSTSVCKFQKYDFLFGSIRPYFYKAGVCPFNGVSNTSVFILRAKNDFDREFMYFYSSSEKTFERSIQYSDGTKMPIIKWNDFKEFKFALPNKELRKNFSSITRPIVDKIIINIEEQETLSNLRDSLLPKLIAGEIKIPDVEELIEEASIK